MHNLPSDLLGQEWSPAAKSARPGARPIITDPRVFARTVQQSYSRLYAYALLMCGKEEEALECIRQGITSAQNKLADNKGLSAEAFALQNVRTYVMMTLRHKRWTPASPTDPEIGHVLELVRPAASMPDFFDRALVLLQSLPLEERESYIMTAVLEYAPSVAEQIAETHSPLIQARLFRACERLANMAEVGEQRSVVSQKEVKDA